jgi:hypothetical protein
MQTRDFMFFQINAIGYPFAALVITLALAGVCIHKLASNFGVVNLTGTGILKLVQAAFGTPVAESLPLVNRECLEWLLVPPAHE